MFETLIITALFVHLLLLFGYSTSALTTRCFPQYEGGSLCFTQPNPPVALSWSSAGQWCKNIGATLPIPDTYNHHAAYGNAVSYFGLHTETLWLSANSTYNLNNYYWTNGTIFTGPIENRNSPGKTHVYILRNGTNTKFVADSPVYSNNYICQDYGSELQCANTGDSFWADGKCYTKYRWFQSWYDSWSDCGQRGLAAIDNLDELARWLENLKKYWIGLRCTWWTWQDFVTGTSREATENRFGYNMPNSSSAECLASYKDYNLDIKWINLDCATQLQFICQQYVNATTTTNETTQTAFTTTTLPTTPAIRSTASSPTTSTTTTTSYSLRTASDGETSKSSMETLKSSMETSKSSTKAVKSSMETLKSSTETVKSSMETLKSSTETVKSSMETLKSSTETVKSSMETLKSSTETVKSSMETLKSSMETVKSSMETVKSSRPMETVEINHFPEINDGSHSINYDPALALGVGLEGGLLMAVIAWLALLTIYAFRKMRKVRHSEISRQRQIVGYPNTKSASRSYDNRAYRDSTEATDKPGEMYEALELQTNEHVYQSKGREDQ